MTLDLTAEEILRAAEEALSTAEFGYRGLTGDAAEWRRPGLRVAITFGRSVTSTLRKLRHHFDDFDSWFQPRTAEMAADQQFRRLYKMRSEMLHEGVLVSGVTIGADGPSSSITITVDGESVSSEAVVRRYLDYLGALVKDAREKFGTDNSV